jgi:hypothetical protein
MSCSLTARNAHCLLAIVVVVLVCRRAQGYDSGLLDTVKDKVTLYSTSVGDAMPFTTLEAAIGPNQILRESRLGSQLTVWVGSRAGEGVRVHLCRTEAATETDCGDGKDNNCDGYTDSEDTDCKAGPSTKRRLLLAPLHEPNTGTGGFGGSALSWRNQTWSVLASPPRQQS